MQSSHSSMPFDIAIRHSSITMLLHIALGIIILGACVTHFFGEQGEIHLRADKAQTLAIRHSSISLFLWDFQVVNDADGNPADFITELRLLDRSKGERLEANGERLLAKVESGMIRMNKPLKYHGWRFCQSDYDSDRQGVVLAYNYDPWGIGITYTGYALLLIAMIAFFFQPHTRFRTLLKKLTTQWSHSAAVALLTALGVLIVILAIIMTCVVTPKPPLQPVLQTPLLGIHVSVIMLAYTLFAVMMVNGILGIYATIASKKASGLRKEKLQITNDKLQIVSQILLYPAVFCLTAGIFIGAVWANMSWGRYWGWDPKETWALITMLVYAALLHFPWLKSLTVKRSRSDLEAVQRRKTKLIVPLRLRSGLGQTWKWSVIYHLCCVVDFLFVLFTYFGVSYLLGGLHSYA